MAQIKAHSPILYKSFTLFTQHLEDLQYCELTLALRLPVDVYIFHISMNHLDLEVREKVFFQQHLNNIKPKKEDHAFYLHLQALLNSSKYQVAQHLVIELQQLQFQFQELFLAKDLQQLQYLIKAR